MKLGVFEFVDKASTVIEEKNNEVKLASRYLRTFFYGASKGARGINQHTLPDQI